MNNRITNKNSMHFREKDVKKIFDYIISGESCSVVGIGSVGKSNLMRFILQDDVSQAYLGPKNKKYLMVYIDGNKKLENTDWGLFELIFHQLYLAVLKSPSANEFAQSIEDLYLRATISLPASMKYLILRFLDRVFSVLVVHLDLNIVLLFDEFDSFFQSISPRAFSILRAMRDDHKYRLTYVIATRTELANLRRESVEVEAFYELVTPNTITLLSYTKKDAEAMLSRLTSRYEFSLKQENKNAILQFSGGHPALIKALFDLSREKVSLDLDLVIEKTRVLDECRRIWAGLSRQEQTALAYISGGRNAAVIPVELQEILRRRGLVGGEWTNESSIFSPIFEKFIVTEQPTVGAQIIIDRERYIVWVNGQKHAGLPRLEFRFIDYLDQHRGQGCSRDDIAAFLYPGEMIDKGEGINDNRIDSIVKRVRKRIEANPDNPRYILTIRGFGFRMANGDEEI